MCFFLVHSEGHIGLERKVTKLEAMVKMLQEDLKKVGEKTRTSAHASIYIDTVLVDCHRMRRELFSACLQPPLCVVLKGRCLPPPLFECLNE